MINIPEQLRNYRFVKTIRKRAIEKGWPIESTRFVRQPDKSWKDEFGRIYLSNGEVYRGDMHSYSAAEIKDEIVKTKENEETYGVLCGYNGLVVVDVDNKKVAEQLMSIEPFASTFTVISGTKRFPHFYFKCEPYSKVIRYTDNKGKSLLDVQGKSTFVIGPNSKIKATETNTYDVTRDLPIMEIAYDDLVGYIDEILDDPQKFQKKEKDPFSDNYITIDPITNEIFKKITCSQILEDAQIDVSSNPGDTPFANSIGKKCLHRSSHLWFDHHINQGGTVITLYSKLHDCDYDTARYELSEIAGIPQETLKKAVEFFVKQKQHDLTEYLTKRFLSQNRVYTIRNDKIREIYIYENGIYADNGKTKIHEFCRITLDKWYSKILSDKIVDKVVVSTYISHDEFFKEAPKELIAVQNGILNINSRELIQFTPDYRFFNKLPVEYVPGKKCEATITHFDTILNGEEDKDVMQELYGYLLYRDYRFEKAFMFYGNGGNGKGKTMEQMKYFIGDHNSANLSLQDLQNEKFMRGNLHRKLANLAADIGKAKLTETKVFKELTGHDLITADRKFLTPISFVNYAKMIFSANNMPESIDDSDGFWRRWELIGFTKKFISSVEYDNLMKLGKLHSNHRRADTQIIEKLTDPEELSGVLNWALDGWDRLLKNNGFSKAMSYEEVKKTWKRNTSSVYAFSQDCIIETYDADDYVTNEELLKEYGEFCRNNKLKPKDDRTVKSQLMEEGYSVQRKQVQYGKEWRWYHIKLKEE